MRYVSFSVRSTPVSRLIYCVEVCSNEQRRTLAEVRLCDDTKQLTMVDELCRSCSRDMVEWPVLLYSYHAPYSFSENGTTKSQIPLRSWFEAGRRQTSNQLA